MKAAIVCQDVYEYNMQDFTSPLKSRTGRQTKIIFKNRLIILGAKGSRKKRQPFRKGCPEVYVFTEGQ